MGLIILSALIIISGLILIFMYAMRNELNRKESIRQTILDSGKTDLTGVLSMYPEEMYDEVTEQYRKLYGSK